MTPIHRIVNPATAVADQFGSRSDDIRAIFKEACEKVGIDCKRSNRWMLAVSRRADVAAMDVLVGHS